MMIGRMEEDYEENGGCLGNLLLGIVFVGVVIWLAKGFYDDYRYGEKKPFWKGTELVQVCKTPYSSSSDCYQLDVKLIDEKTAQINFKNGGYVFTYDVTCYFTTIYQYGKAIRYVFCRSWDEDNQQWDFLPSWVNY